MDGNGQDYTINDDRRARSAVRRCALRSGALQGNRPHHAAISQADRSRAVRACWRPAVPKASTARRAAIRRVSCALSTSIRCIIPDRRGNNRIDSLRNLVRDPRISLLFLIPGVGETMRINGRATISTDPKLTESFVINGKTPKCVLVVTVETRLLPVHQGDHPLETVGPGQQSRSQDLADAGLDPCRIDRRQDGRARARPPRAGAHQSRRFTDGRVSGRSGM